MNSNQIPKPEESLDELDIDTSSSVDDFIKELEAKEKDLHITADLTIEVEETDFDPGNIPAFVQQELPVAAPATPTTNQGQSGGMKTRVFELENEIDALQDRIKNLRGERNEIQEKSDRRLKDFENYKYRMDRERRGAFIDQISNLASQMLPVLDNLHRALGPTDTIKTEKDAEFQQFYDGIALVNHQVNEVFSEMGVQPIASVGEVFDPNFHEAVAVEERDDVAANTIVEEMLRGYRIGNRVIRHSMVKVTTAPPSAKKETPVAAPDDETKSLETPDNNPPESAVSNDANE
jgi:molecular chaperone GrpE